MITHLPADKIMTDNDNSATSVLVFEYEQPTHDGQVIPTLVDGYEPQQTVTGGTTPSHETRLLALQPLLTPKVENTLVLTIIVLSTTSIAYALYRLMLL
jgi:hypothetical protein